MLKDKRHKAKKSLYRARGRHFDAESEVAKIEKAQDEMRKIGTVGLRGVLSQSVYLKPLLLMLGVQTFCQFTGLAGITLYMSEIFIKAGFDADKSLYNSAAVSSAQVGKVY